MKNAFITPVCLINDFQMSHQVCHIIFEKKMVGGVTLEKVFLKVYLLGTAGCLDIYIKILKITKIKLKLSSELTFESVYMLETAGCLIVYAQRFK